jgi:predicted nuclease with TOPRIM domain
MNNLLKKCIVLVAAAAAASTSLAQSSAQSNFDLARATLENWVETRQLISKEKADWEVERQALTDSVELLKKEMATLDENIERAEGDTTAADTEREKLLAENEALKGAAATVGNLIGAIEQ